MPGWLPLAQGMPVALTDHLDRSSGKLLLRGREATVDHWAEHEDEVSRVSACGDRVLAYMPRMIVLDFHTDTFHLPTMERPGLYPIFPKERTWHLDGYRKQKIFVSETHPILDHARVGVHSTCRAREDHESCHCRPATWARGWLDGKLCSHHQSQEAGRAAHLPPIRCGAIPGRRNGRHEVTITKITGYAYRLGLY